VREAGLPPKQVLDTDGRAIVLSWECYRSVPVSDSREKATIKIPRPLYNRIRELIAHSGYDSPTDFIVHVLRDIVSSRTVQGDEFDAADLERVKERLRRLGYL